MIIESFFNRLQLEGFQIDECRGVFEVCVWEFDEAWCISTAQHEQHQQQVQQHRKAKQVTALVCFTHYCGRRIAIYYIYSARLSVNYKKNGHGQSIHGHKDNVHFMETLTHLLNASCMCVFEFPKQHISLWWHNNINSIFPELWHT